LRREPERLEAMRTAAANLARPDAAAGIAELVASLTEPTASDNSKKWSVGVVSGTDNSKKRVAAPC
jgi:hypothetical protein